MLSGLSKKIHSGSSKSSNKVASLRSDRSTRSTQQSLAHPETPTPSPRQKVAENGSEPSSTGSVQFPPPHSLDSEEATSQHLHSEGVHNDGPSTVEAAPLPDHAETSSYRRAPSSSLNVEPTSHTPDTPQVFDSRSPTTETGAVSEVNDPELDGLDDDTSLFSSKETDASVSATGVPSSRLYSAFLTEAVNDTPAFRASAEFIDAQLRALDQWLIDLAVKSRKVVTELMTVKDSVNDLIKLFMPSATHSSILAHDYTTLLFGRYTELESTFWLDLVGSISKTAAETEKMVKSLREKAMSKYNQSRRDYLFALKVRDDAVSSLMRMPEGSEPAALRDVCHASYIAQVKYIKAATSLVVCITALESEVTLSLLETLGQQFFENADGIQATSPSRFGMASDFFRLRKFAEKLRLDLPHLKSRLKRMQHSLLREARGPRPPTSLKEYSDTELPYIETPQQNKCGWVNVEIKPKTWVMLWAYVSNGFFGFLGTSENRTAVIESARYLVNDLTFEVVYREGKNSLFLVKCPDMQLVVQTQGKFQLAEWKAAFKASQSLYDSGKSETMGSSNTAEGDNYQPPVECLPWNRSFAIPGLFSAIAYGSDDIVAKIHELRRDMGASPWLCYDSSISGNENIVGGINVPSVKPLPTSVPLEATAANCYFKPSGVPNAITSNIWGCLPGSSLEDGDEIHRSTHYDGSYSRYPENYPRALIYQDMDMRVITSQLSAEEQIDEKDRLLFVIRCAILLDGSEAPARIYVTSKKLIVYCIWSGIAHLESIALSSVLNIELIDNVLCSDLNIESSSYHGEIANLPVKLYIDSGVLVKRYLEIVVTNCRSNHPKSSQELFEPITLEMLDHCSAIQRNYEMIQSYVVGENLTKALLESQMDRKNFTSALLSSNSSPGLSISSDADDGADAFGDQRENKHGLRFKLAEDTFPVSARTLFATMFGPDSPVFNGHQNRLLESSLKAGPWYRKGKRVERRIVQLIHLPADNGPPKKRYNYQCIDHQDNNVSIVTEKLSAWEMPRGDRFYSTMRYTVYRSELGSHLQIWCEIIWQKRVSGSEAEISVRNPHKMIAQGLILRIRDAVSKVKSLEDAQRLYGKVRPTKYIASNSSELEDALAVTRVNTRSMAVIFARFSNFNILRRLKWLLLDVFYITVSSSGKQIFFLLITLLSLYANYALWSRSSRGYWDAVLTSQEVGAFVDALNLAADPESMVFRRALYLQDINDMMANNSIWVSAKSDSGLLGEISPSEDLQHHGCASKFAELARLTGQDFGTLYEYEPKVKHALEKLNSVRLDFAIKRNELSSIMRLLNAREIEALQKMYRSWILEEAATCHKARITLQSVNASVLQDIRTYCINCLEESRQFI